MYQIYLPQVPKLIFCLVLERKDLEAGVIDGPDKGSKSKKISVRLQVMKKEDIPEEIPQILYLHRTKKRGEIENSQQVRSNFIY